VRRVALDSSTIASAGYDEASAILEIAFAGGLVYRYRDVPPREFQALVGADSAGAYFNARIRGTFDYDRIDP
jgi:lysyl-tRNA synthetase class 2